MSARLQHFLLIYSAVLSTVFGVFLLSGAKAPAGKKFDEISVQRINVIEPDGTLRMVISDHARLPGIIVKGKENPLARPQAGMIFYNDEGSETGGLIFGGRKNAKGEIVDSGGSLSFDRYEANQIVQLAGVHDSTDRFAGLAVSDDNRRVWVGRSEEGKASVTLMDAKGRKRLSLEVTADGAPSFSFFDDRGAVVRQFTPTTPR
jgi:hypothetical protein